MRDVIQNPIRFDPEKGIWMLDGFGGIAYSDGAEAERYVRRCVQSATDLSSTSDELAGMARDWPSQYHLSTKRSQLLSGFRMDPAATALEIGCGCGAVTRLLGERLSSVHAVEGSVLRAEIAAARCRDLDGVEVVAAPFHELQIARRYDLVFCIGVLEYSRMFIEAEDPVQACLEYLKDRVAPNGRLVLAIENQFGLQYFSGCVEDHTGVQFDGIEGYAARGDEGPVTFGRAELEDRLSEAGFEGNHFFLAFPDYKLPDCLIDERAASNATVNLGGLVRRLPKPARGHEAREFFCDPLAWWELGRNRALPTFSPSFLVVSGGPGNQGPIRADWQAMLYTMARRPGYRTLTAFHELDTRSPVVRKLSAVEGAPEAEVLSIHRDTAPFVKGMPLDIRMLRAARNQDRPFARFLAELEIWAMSLWSFVEEEVSDEALTDLPAPDRPLGGRSIDATPWNALLSDGAISFIDLEWEWAENLPVHYIVSRSLLHFVESYPTTGIRMMAAGDTIETWIDACFRALWPDTAVDWKGFFLQHESDFMEGVVGIPSACHATYYVRRLAQQLIPQAAAQKPAQAPAVSSVSTVRPAASPAMSSARAASASSRVGSGGNAPEVSIVIPVYNNLDYTKACLDSVFATTADVACEIIVVDNASTDGTRAYLESHGDRIRTIFNAHNAGFAGANNQAAAVAAGRYLLYLNNDTVARPGWLKAMVKAMREDDRVAIVGSKLLYPDGTIQHAGMAFADGCNSVHVYRGGDLARHVIVNRQREMQTVTGGCLMLRRGVVEEPSVFDEVFINGCEDVDLCLRVREMGYKVVYCPTSELIHHESKTQGRKTYDICNHKILKQRWDGRVTPDIQLVMAQDGIQPAPGGGDTWSWSQNRMRDPQPPPALKPAWRVPLKPQVSIVIPVRNRHDEIEACLRRVAAASADVPVEIIVVDNGSTDGTVGFLERVTDEILSTIPAETDLGIGGALKVAARIARGQTLVAADVTLDPEEGWLKKVVGQVSERAVVVGEGEALAIAFARDRYDELTGIGECRSLSDIVQMLKDSGDGAVVADVNGRSGANVDRRPAVVWQAPIYDPSGYADEARHFILGLEDRGYYMKAHSIGRYSEAFRQELDDVSRRRLDGLLALPIPRPFINVINFPGYVLQRVPDARYHIGRVVFESDGLPADWIPRLNQMDEIWTASEFNLETFRNAGVKTRLVKIQQGVDADRFHPDLEPMEIPGARGFVYLSIFEWTLRKGWDVLLRSWAEAFGADDDVCLVMRTYPQNDLNGEQAKLEIERRIDHFLREKLGLSREQVAPIIVMGDQLPEGDVPSLYAAADAYVIPSRGEGWGRTHMEAMACGLPVIATRWSGNLEFMNDENSYLIDVAGMVDLDQATELNYFHGQLLAEPSASHLTRLMREVNDDRAASARVAERARRDIVERWRWEHAYEAAAARLEEIFGELAEGKTHEPAVSSLAVTWEGSQFVTHSLAHVNREICLKLMASDAVDMSLVPYEPHEFGHEADPRFAAIQTHLNRNLGRPTDIHVRHQWPPSFSPPAEGRWVMVQPWEFGRIPRAWVAPMQERVDEVWVPSTFVKQCYVDSGVDPDRVQVVRNGVDVERFTPDAEPIAIPSDKTFKFLFVGGTIYRKGIDVLLDSYVKAFRREDDVCLVIKDMGQSTFYRNQNAGDRIRRIQQDSDAPEIVYLTETIPVDRMAGLYTACDCLVHPYRGEGFGLPVAEAMACGLPVVVTRGGACDDFCSDDNAYRVASTRRDVNFAEETVGHAWLLEPDRDSLIEAMRQVLAYPDAARRKSRLGRETILSGYTWQRAAEEAVARMKALSTRPVRRTGALPSSDDTSSASGGAAASTNRRKSQSDSGRLDVSPDPSSAGQVPAAAAPVGPAPVVEAPTDETPFDEIPGDEIPGDEIPGDEIPVDVIVVPGGPGGDRNTAAQSIETFTKSPIRLISVNLDSDALSCTRLVNSILQAAECDYVALVRDDVHVPERWLVKMLAHMKDDPTVGLVAPRVPVGAGFQHVSPDYDDLGASFEAFAEGFGAAAGEEAEELVLVSGGCVLVRTASLRALGGLDETFHTWAAMDDLSRRLRQLGFRSLLAPDVFVHCAPPEAGSETAEREARERWAVEQLEVGDRHRAQGEHGAAIARYRDALSAKDDYLEVRLVLSAALLEQGEPEEAVELFLEMEGRHPDSSRVKNYLGRCLYQAGRAEEAERTFERALVLDEAFAEAHSNLGVLYWESGRLDMALAELTRATELTPGHPDVIYNVAMVYAQLGQAKEAMETLRVYVTLKPADLQARVYFAVLLLENNAVSDGLTELEYVLSVEPGHPDAIRVIGQLQETVSVAGGDADDASSPEGI